MVGNGCSLLLMLTQAAISGYMRLLIQPKHLKCAVADPHACARHLQNKRARFRAAQMSAETHFVQFAGHKN